MNNDHPLNFVFEAVLRQVTTGKGERHGGEATPFYAQQWVTLANQHGAGFLTGQAAKKLNEAASRYRAGQTHQAAYIQELLGAMVYIGMAVLHEQGLPEVNREHY